MNEVETIIKEELDRMVEDIIRASEDAGQRASGKTYEMITVEIGRDDDAITGTIYAPSYFYTLIRGRGAGKIPYNFADIIMDWARYKGISFQDPKEFVRWANAVAWKIRREGSALYRSHGYVDLIDTPARAFEERFEQRLDRAWNAQIDEAFEALIEDFRPQ